MGRRGVGGGRTGGEARGGDRSEEGQKGSAVDGA